MVLITLIRLMVRLFVLVSSLLYLGIRRVFRVCLWLNTMVSCLKRRGRRLCSSARLKNRSGLRTYRTFFVRRIRCSRSLLLLNLSRICWMLYLWDLRRLWCRRWILISRFLRVRILVRLCRRSRILLRVRNILLRLLLVRSRVCLCICG